MNKILSIFILFFLPLSGVLAEKWDFNEVGTLKQCTMIKYRCELGSDYHITQTHCGCIQILSDKNMTDIDTLLQWFIMKMNSKWLSEQSQLIVIESLRKNMYNKASQDKTNTLLMHLWKYSSNRFLDFHEENFN